MTTPAAAPASPPAAVRAPAPEADAEARQLARLDLERVSGDVEVTVDGATDGRYELRSFSGDVEACFGPEPERQRYGPGRRLDFTEGVGGPLVRIQTMSGEIEVCDRAHGRARLARRSHRRSRLGAPLAAGTVP